MRDYTLDTALEELMKYSLCITSPEITKDFVFSMMDGPFEKKLSDMARLGYDAIELLCGYPRDCDYNRVLEVCRRNSLGISDVSSGAVSTVTGLRLLDPDREKRHECANLFSDMIDLAAKLGSHIITIGAFRGWAKDVTSIPQAEEMMADILSGLESKLAEYDVSVALEPVNRGQTDIFNTCAQTLSFIERAGLKKVGVLYDTYNADATEDDPIDALEKVLDAKKLLHFHIADTDRMIPGMGMIDFPAYLKVLKEGTYDGYLSGELKSGSDPVYTGRMIITNMKKFETCIQ